MSAHLLVLMLGIASSVTLIISALSVHKYRLLSFSVATGIIVSLEYGILGAYAGLAINIIGTIRTLMVVGSFKRPWLDHKLWIPFFLVVHTIAFSLVTDWSHLTWMSFIPLIGGWGGTVLVSFKEVLHIKMLLIVLGALWIVYEFNNAMYSQMVGESLNFVANNVALFTLLAARRHGIPEPAVEDLDTHLIDVITTSIPVVRDSLEKALTGSIHTVHPSGHHKGPRAVRGAHGSSVAYARRLEAQESNH